MNYAKTTFRLWLYLLLLLSISTSACSGSNSTTDAGADSGQSDAQDGAFGDDASAGDEDFDDGGDESVDDGGDENVDGDGDENVDGGGDESADGDGDESVDGGGDESADGGGDESIDGAGDESVDGAGDEEWQFNHAAVNLTGDFNEWDPDDPVFAFQPVGPHQWRLTVPFEEGLVAFKLTTDGNWDINYGASPGAVAHFDSSFTIVESGPDIPFVCLHSGNYLFEYNDESKLLGVNFESNPVMPPAAWDADPAIVDNRAMGARLIDDAIADSPDLPQTIADLLARGGNPLRGAQRLHFFALAPAGQPDPIYLAGTFNAWDSAALAMQPLGDTRLRYASIIVPAEHLAYKFVQSGLWRDDPWNPNVEWDGIPIAGVGDFNSTLPQLAIDRTAGRLVRLQDYASTTMADQRDVFVYIPLEYDLDSDETEFPLMVVHDGNESITRSQFDSLASAEIAAGRVQALVMIFVALPSQNIRLDEYTFNTETSRGDLYRTFIADELLPFLSGHFRLSASPENRAVFGCSLGGLISYYIGWERHDVFGLVAGMSSSFFWDDNWMIDEVVNDAGPLRPLGFYLDSADVNDNYDVTILMRDALQAKGYTVRHVVQAGASHDWFFWNQRFPEMLQYLFPQ
jgi:iron(III)-enterobactin esterase